MERSERIASVAAILAEYGEDRAEAARRVTAAEASALRAKLEKRASRCPTIENCKLCERIGAVCCSVHARQFPSPPVVLKPVHRKLARLPAKAEARARRKLANR